MKAVGIASLWFANRAPVLDIRTFEPATHLHQVQQALESVDNVSHVTVRKVPVAHQTFRLLDDGDGNLTPLIAWAQIAFDIYLPERVQQSYARHSVVAGGIENFSVKISYGTEFPVAYIYYDVNTSTGRENPSDAVIIIREYLTTKLSDNNDVRLCWLGPSPFHANILVAHVEHQSDYISVEGTARGRGYASLIYKIRNDHAQSEIDSFIDEFDTLLGCYYSIVRNRNESMSIESKILKCTSSLCQRPSDIWQRIRTRIRPKRRRLIDETFAAVLDYKMHNIQTAAYIAEQKREGIIDETSSLYPIFERQIAELAPMPMQEVRDILKIAEDRHQRVIANTTTLLAGLTGAAIGAGLTYFLTLSGNGGVDWTIFP